MKPGISRHLTAIHRSGLSRPIRLEIWKPTEPTLRNCIEKERDDCRKQVFKALYEEKKKTYCGACTKTLH